MLKKPIYTLFYKLSGEIFIQGSFSLRHFFNPLRFYMYSVLKLLNRVANFISILNFIFS